ncbi:YciI family protein [Notoacmeibacter sp. MSK16QG-6]|uniref:YciI family protein n=1 Tax=Notoacmeibacter sp. MSK16QG-6 TaxID=2957982 RepID=UPI00209F2C1F|nr:YciI family protein [Notoacmeibacter sp. MSK16QG-6]MCP1199251.1 YciI family protein [Notoacmeibacter sp. MSK16QG-6]
MHYALICTDKPDSVSLRMETREKHLAWLKSYPGDGEVVAAGPFLDDSGAMTGSMLIVEAPDRQAAEAIAADDPYAKAGLFSAVEIKAWKWVVGNPQDAA